MHIRLVRNTTTTTTKHIKYLHPIYYTKITQVVNILLLGPRGGTGPPIEK